MHSPIQFLNTKDGIRIAYCVHGEGPPLIFVRGWISHLELHWDDPAFRAYFEALARQYRLVRYDVRGNGLSQRDIPEVDLDALVLDLEAVIEELALADVILYGASFGGPIAMAYAARHPERTAKLVLEGTYARGQEIADPERQASIVATMRDMPEAGFLLLSHYTHPDPQSSQYRRPEIGPQLIDPAMAAQLYALGFKIDVSALLPKIAAPTLVLHRRKSRSIPFRLGVDVASRIPGARFIALEGRAHNLFEGDAATALAAIGDFLGVTLELEPADDPADEGQAPLTVLFTDLTSSTALTQRLGDAQAQELLRAHNHIVREALDAHGGHEIKHTGDGIMVSFVSASRALDCAMAIQRSTRSYVEEHPDAPLQMHIGLNAGEPIAEEEDLFGTVVQLARRICDQAQPGEILVSDIVRQLVMGKNFLFSDYGAVELRGFEDPVRLYEVRWAE